MSQGGHFLPEHSFMLKSYGWWWGGWVAHVIFVSTPFGLDFGTLDFGTLDLGLTIEHIAFRGHSLGVGVGAMPCRGLFTLYIQHNLG